MKTPNKCSNSSANKKYDAHNFPLTSSVMKLRKYYWMKNQSRQENLMYIVLWGMLFAAPLLTLYIRTVGDSAAEFNWEEVLMVWQQFGVYLLLFAIHNYLLAPLLIHQQRRISYAVAVVTIIALFTTYQCSHHPREFGPDKHRMGRYDGPPPMHDEQAEGPDRPDAGQHQWPRHGHRYELRHNGPPAVIGQHDVVAIIVLILMLAANLGTKYYFKNRQDEKRLADLEHENLEQQLEYLRYQINPHFFMNTLNNIHALVDIDPEKAKDTILELSKMMRFVLYEGDKHGVPLTREFDFIRHYVTLMKLRYTDKVRISVDLPTEAPDKLIPPLMLITFIENAFKHGISYQHESFIEVKVGIEHERLRFQCRNSKADKPNQEKGGVGLANVKQRLHLLYDNNFTLNIQDEPDIYNVELTIPLT